MNAIRYPLEGLQELSLHFFGDKSFHSCLRSGLKLG